MFLASMSLPRLLSTDGVNQLEIYSRVTGGAVIILVVGECTTSNDDAFELRAQGNRQVDAKYSY